VPLHLVTCLSPFSLERLIEIAGLINPPADECWPWRTDRNYPSVIDPRTRRYIRVSRLAYELATGAPPVDLICHHCDNPHCFNPSHLFDGTHHDNSQDMVKKDRWSNQFRNRS
jgi:hypothetical protein